MHERIPMVETRLHTRLATKTGSSSGRRRAAGGMPSRSKRRVSKMRAALALMLPAVLGTSTLLNSVSLPKVAAAPVGQGFTITPSDLAFILKQIKIAEAHVANTTVATGPCGALLGQGPNQVPTPLTSYGLRTVDGSCNNLQVGRERFGASDETFPRLANPEFRNAEPAIFGPPAPTSYQSKSGAVVDSEPRVISNLIVDQTTANPAAVSVAGNARRGIGGGVVPCTAPGVPTPDCVPPGHTLDIPNVTTDVGLSPPYNSLFTVFGQFFDHGLDFTNKSNDPVFIPLKADDPLIPGPDGILGTTDDLPPGLRFMILSRTLNQAGPDNILGNADDIQDGKNTDTPYVDLSQNYGSHPSRHIFLRDYVLDTNGKPVSTGKLLHSADGGLANWKLIKEQAASKLGLLLVDANIFNVPMIASDPYGKFLPGPVRGLPMFVTASGMVEGDIANPVPVPNDAKHIDSAFLDDIAHGAVPKPGKAPDADTTITPLGVQQAPGTYDDEMLDAHFVVGDGRTNENIGLTAIHTVLHNEHNRVLEDVMNILTNDTSSKGVAALPEWQITAANGGGAAGWNGERLFQAARFVTEMEYQHLVFEEFARKVQPLIQPFSVYHDNINGAISAEFASAVYRFGHSMLTDTIPRINENGLHNDISLFDGFLNPPSFTDGGSAGTLTSKQGAGAIIMGMSDEVGQELDEFVADTLRNHLVGLPLDLATLNITRGRDAGVPRLNNLRRQIHAKTNDAAMHPYVSWLDFSDNLKNAASAVNFVAAYGTHPSLLAETTIVGKRTAAQLLVDPPLGTDPALIPADALDFLTSAGAWATAPTGLEDVDLWVGGLAERTNLFGGLLGSTFNYVFETQMTDLQNGDRFYYLARTPGMNLRAQLEGNSFAEMMMRNTTAKALKADSFATADCKFDLNTITLGSGTSVNDDPNSECNENLLLQHIPVNGVQELRYRTSNSIDPPGLNKQSVYNGTPANDRVRGGVDNDTFLGNAGNDRIEGNDGADIAIGGEGDDIITDSAGDDVPKGGPGNDAIDAGPGIDIVMPGPGKDFTNGGLNDNETFGGPGDDFVIAGAGNDTVFGDSGSDWIEGGNGQDLLCGDSCAPFFDDPNDPGNDILIGQNGEEDYDAEGGDDILVAGPGIERNAGAAGYDWVTHQGDPVAADADLNLVLAAVGLPAGVLRDRYQEVEALSGWDKSDILRGDSVVPATVGGAGGFTGFDWLTQASLANISGLNDLLPPAAQATIAGGGTWGQGNIILGGGGSDLLEGRGADDILDGDKYVNVRLSVRTNAADPATQIGTTELMENTFQAGNPKTLQQAVFAGEINPANIVAVREVLTSAAGPTNVDTALFSGPRAAYTFTLPANVTVPFTVTDNGNAGRAAVDGVDTLTNIECLQFSDIRVAVSAACNKAPTGTVTISSLVPTENVTLTATNNIVDPDTIVGPITYTWYANLSGTTWTPVGSGATFVPTNSSVGFALRVVAMYTDGLGFTETVTSASTAPVINVNDPATGAPAISTTSAQEGVLITASLGTVADLDGLPAPALITYQWLANGSPIAGAITDTFDPVGHVGETISVQVKFTDLHGTPEQRVSVATAPVLAAPVVPDAPAIGTATSGGVGSVTVTWTAPFDGRSSITSYDVQVLDSANVQVGTLRPATAGSTSLLVTGLVPGTYTLKVRASNIVGAGPFSAASAPVSPQGPPGATVIGAATGGLNTATANWSAPASDGGSPLTGYIVRLRDSAAVQVGPDRPVAAGTTTLTVAPLPAGTYTFVVLAKNINGDGPLSAASNTVTVTAPTPPSAPTVASATPGITSVVVAWTAPASDGGSAVTNYRVRTVDAASVQVGAILTVPATTTTATISGLTSSTPYSFQVLAVNAVGDSVYSTAFGPVSTLAAPTAPGAPTIASAVRGNNSVTVNWTPPGTTGGSPITGYVVRVRNTATNVQVGALRPAAATATSLVVTGLTNGTGYTFQVAAVNAIGPSAYSADSASVIPATVPTAPNILGVVRGANGLPVTATVAWIALNNGGSPITGFVVYSQELNAANAPVGAPIVSPVLPAGTLSYTPTFAPAKVGINFRFQVEAINAVGTSAKSTVSARVQVR
jgi:Ca2+-binding RTX toxin-like protein